MDDPDDSFWPLESWQLDVIFATLAIFVGIVIGFVVPLVA
jgi:hypothetical protein